MKKIMIRGSFDYTLVDDLDYEKLVNREWILNSGGYVTQMYLKNIPKKYSTMTNEIIKPEKGFIVDHIDGNKLNNCRSNLRIATHSENMRNRHKKCFSSSRYKGVHRLKRGNSVSWIAYIKLNGEDIYLGSYKTENEAAIAYNNASLDLHGVFSSPNDICEDCISHA